MATARQTMQIYLEPAQKAALRKRAKAKGTKVAEEISNAVDSYLAGVTRGELELLDKATLDTEKHLSTMAAELDATNRRLKTVFTEIEKLRRAKQRSVT